MGCGTLCTCCTKFRYGVSPADGAEKIRSAVVRREVINMRANDYYQMPVEDIKSILSSDPDMVQHMQALPVHLSEKNIQDFLGGYCNASIYRLMHQKSFPLLSVGCRRVIVPRPLFFQWYYDRCVYRIAGPAFCDMNSLQVLTQDEDIRVKIIGLPLHLDFHMVQSFLDLSPATIYRLIREGRIPYLKTGIRCTLIPRSLFLDWYCRQFSNLAENEI